MISDFHYIQGESIKEKTDKYLKECQQETGEARWSKRLEGGEKGIKGIICKLEKLYFEEKFFQDSKWIRGEKD